MKTKKLAKIWKTNVEKLAEKSSNLAIVIRYSRDTDMHQDAGMTAREHAETLDELLKIVSIPVAVVEFDSDSYESFRANKNDTQDLRAEWASHVFLTSLVTTQ